MPREVLSTLSVRIRPVSDDVYVAEGWVFSLHIVIATLVSSAIRRCKLRKAQESSVLIPAGSINPRCKTQSLINTVPRGGLPKHRSSALPLSQAFSETGVTDAV